MSVQFRPPHPKGDDSHKNRTSVRNRVLAFISLFSLLLTVASASAFATDQDQAAIRTDVHSLLNNSNSLLSAVGSVSGGRSILYYLGLLNTDINAIKTSLGSGTYTISYLLNSLVSETGQDIPAIKSDVHSTNGLVDDIYDVLGLAIGPDVRALKEFFDNPEHEALESASEDTVTEATSLTGTSIGGKSTSQSASAFGGMSSGLGQFFDTSVDADDMFSIFQNGDTGLGDGSSVFDFFSLDCALDMDANYLGTRAFDPAKNPQIVTDYYGANQRAFERLKGGDER